MAVIKRGELIILHNKNVLRLVKSRTKLYRMVSQLASRRRRQREMVALTSSQTGRINMLDDATREKVRKLAEQRVKDRAAGKHVAPLKVVVSQELTPSRRVTSRFHYSDLSDIKKEFE